MNVLSLFDGISCGQVALNRLGIKYDNYFASEIDKYAIKITQKNYPNTIQIGDVTQVKAEDLPKIDLLIGGSPCQGFSSSGKRLNFKDPRSKLFFEYVRLLRELRPKYFLLENVKMVKEQRKIIDNFLKCGPIEINSNLVSAQIRKRLYWTNIPNVGPLENKNIALQDILNDKQLNPASIVGRRLNKDGKRDDYNENFKRIQCLEVRKTNLSKSYCLTTVGKDNVLTPLGIGRHQDAFNENLPFRYYTPLEYEILQTLTRGYTIGVSDGQRKKLIAQGWTIDVICHILKGLRTHT